jgi:hypothetical protein
LRRLEWILRIAVFGEFLGHGILALQQRTSFLFLLEHAMGMPESMGRHALLVIGAIDVLIATSALLRPWGPALLYAAAWGFVTALSRPMAGLTIWEFVERWPNWAAPLALYFVAQGTRESEVTRKFARSPEVAR